MPDNFLLLTDPEAALKAALETDADEDKLTEYRGYTISIVPDDNPPNPREDDNLGSLLCWSSRHTLGDAKPQSLTPEKFKNSPEYREAEKGILIPISKYEHGNIHLYAGHHQICRWDSCSIGYHFATKAMIRKWFGVKRVMPNTLKKAREILESELKTYNAYISGEMVCYRLYDPMGARVDSGYGYISSDDALKEAKSSVDFMVDNRKESENAATT